MQKKSKVLIIGSRNRANRRILHECKQLGQYAMIADPQHFILSVSDKMGHDKIYYKGKRIYKNSIDYIIVRAGNNFKTAVKVVEHLTKNLNIPASATHTGMLGASDKFECSQILSQARIKTPKSVFAQNTSEYSLLIKLAGGLPVVAKLTHGSQGAGVFILNDELSGSTALSTISRLHPVVLQEYIETAKKDENKSDLRLFVVNGEVVAAMKRYSIKGDFRSNYTISKSAIKVKATENQKTLAIKAAESLGLTICGVDIVTDVHTGDDYVIEVNSNPGLKIEQVTGINVCKKIAEMAADATDHKPNESLWSQNPVNQEAIKLYDSMNRHKTTLEPDEKKSEPEISFDDDDQGVNIYTAISEEEDEQEFNWITDVNLLSVKEIELRFHSLNHLSKS